MNIWWIELSIVIHAKNLIVMVAHCTFIAATWSLHHPKSQCSNFWIYTIWLRKSEMQCSINRIFTVDDEYDQNSFDVVLTEFLYQTLYWVLFINWMHRSLNVFRAPFNSSFMTALVCLTSPHIFLFYFLDFLSKWIFLSG